MSGSCIRPYLGPLIAVVVILALGVGTVYAAIPNPTNKKFYACFVKSTGVVRLINYPTVSTCPKGQRLIDWNAKGPVGQQGPQGVQGMQGPVGPQGPAGEAGITNITLTKKVQTFNANEAIGQTGSVDAVCPAGKVVGGGFAQWEDNLRVINSYPVTTDTWRVKWKKMEADEGVVGPPVYAYAICMTTDPAGVITTAKVKVAKKKGR